MSYTHGQRQRKFTVNQYMMQMNNADSNWDIGQVECVSPTILKVQAELFTKHQLMERRTKLGNL